MMMNITKMIAYGLLTGLLWARAAAGAATNSPPNLVFILGDDLGKEWISCYGATDIQTPNIDALAAQGIRFDHFYAMPQCTPSRIALMTGKYPWRNGWVNHWDVPAWGIAHFDWRLRQNMTVFRLLRDQGYKTAVAGKWQVNDFRLEPDAMRRHGFDDWFMWTGAESDNPPSGARYYDPYIHSSEGSRTYPGEFGPDLYANFLIDFMRQNKDRPFAIYYAMCLPHIPFTTTPDEPGATGDLNRHKAMVRYMDKLVGRVIATLEEEGLRERTIVIYATDNGSTTSITGTRNGRAVPGAKQQLIEAGACLPFIASAPGLVPTGVVSEALADFTDLLPTFIDLAGGTVPGDLAIDGHSLAQVLLGNATTNDRTWIMSLGGDPATTNASGTVVNVDTFDERAIRDQRYKVLVSTGKAITALYDLLLDPWELTNKVNSANGVHVAAKAKFQAVLNSLPNQDANPAYTPWDRDSDGDGLPDVDETNTGTFGGAKDTGTSPHNADSDADGWSDGDEVNMGTDPNSGNFVPLAANMAQIRLPLQASVVVSQNGTVTNPMTATGLTGVASVTTNDLFLRERAPGINPEYRARLFLKFDLTSVMTQSVGSAWLELRQFDRANSATTRSPIVVGRLTGSWDVSGTNFPLFAASAAGDRVIGTNDQFGTGQASPGVYTGLVTDIVKAWHDGSAANRGFRVAFSDQVATRTGIYRVDQPGTPALDEAPVLVVAHYNPDLDGDGLPDAWEVFRFGSITNSDGSVDSDEDGATDIDELAANTNPAGTGSVLAVESIAPGPHSMRVNFSSAPARRYTLATSTNGLQSWTPVRTNILPTPPANEVTVPLSDAPLFLRVGADTP